MRKFKNETIVITKDAYFFLRNEFRVKEGYKPLNNEQLERIWSRFRSRNIGENNKTHPIAENEIRIDKDTFGFKLELAKEMLMTNGFIFRQDDFIQEGIYI